MKTKNIERILAFARNNIDVYLNNYDSAKVLIYVMYILGGSIDKKNIHKLFIQGLGFTEDKNKNGTGKGVSTTAENEYSTLIDLKVLNYNKDKNCYNLTDKAIVFIEGKVNISNNRPIGSNSTNIDFINRNTLIIDMLIESNFINSTTLQNIIVDNSILLNKIKYSAIKYKQKTEFFPFKVDEKAAKKSNKYKCNFRKLADENMLVLDSKNIIIYFEKETLSIFRKNIKKKLLFIRDNHIFNHKTSIYLFNINQSYFEEVIKIRGEIGLNAKFKKIESLNNANIKLERDIILRDNELEEKQFNILNSILESTLKNIPCLYINSRDNVIYLEQKDESNRQKIAIVFNKFMLTEDVIYSNTTKIEDLKDKVSGLSETYKIIEINATREDVKIFENTCYKLSNSLNNILYIDIDELYKQRLFETLAYFKQFYTSKFEELHFNTSLNLKTFNGNFEIEFDLAFKNTTLTLIRINKDVLSETEEQIAKSRGVNIISLNIDKTKTRDEIINIIKKHMN